MLLKQLWKYSITTYLTRFFYQLIYINIKIKNNICHFHNWIQPNYQKNQFKFVWIETKFNSNWLELNWIHFIFKFNQIKFHSNFNENINLIKCRGEKYCVQYNLIQWNFNFIQCIWIQFKNLNMSCQLNCIQFKLHYEFIHSIFSFKWNLIFTKSIYFFHHFIVISSVEKHKT